MPSLFDPLPIRGITLRNRFGVSPMCMYSSIDGHATDWHLVHLGSRAVGGYALVMAEATAVDPRGRISPDDAGIWDDSHVEPLTRITRFIKEHGAVPAIQLAHAGRKASTARPWGHPIPNKPLKPDQGAWPTVAPSPIPFAESYPVPHELTAAEIQSLIGSFASATHRALAAGFDIIEIHAAHGYLLNEFLSPLSNHRTDNYGGTFENRTRFLRQVVEETRRILPQDKPLIVRLSCTDWAEGGWQIADSVALARILKGMGVDVIDCSSGGLVPPPLAKMVVEPNYQVPFSETIRKEAGIMTAAVGLITSAQQAEEIIDQGQADLVFTARQALRDPYFPVHAARELGHPEALHLPPQYLRS